VTIFCVPPLKAPPTPTNIFCAKVIPKTEDKPAEETKKKVTAAAKKPDPTPAAPIVTEPTVTNISGEITEDVMRLKLESCKTAADVKFIFNSHTEYFAANPSMRSFAERIGKVRASNPIP
jgi:hypothetical protein